MLPTIPAQYLTSIIIVLGVFAIVTLILAIIAISANGSLRKKVRKWKDIHATADLEEVYNQTMHAVTVLKKRHEELNAEIERLQQALLTKVNTPIIHRYNAFAEMGSDLSYSIAMLDDKQNGAVLTSIYGREESHTYGKPVASGTSSYPLTGEEERAIELARNCREPLMTVKS